MSTVMRPERDRQRDHVLRLFERRARAAPEATAVADDAGAFTYGDLAAFSLRAAAYLRALGVDLGDAVGVALRPKRWVAAALLAIFSVGGVAVPIDPGRSRSQTRAARRRARCVTTIVDSTSLDELGPGAGTLIALDHRWHRIQGYEPIEDDEIDLHDPALVAGAADEEAPVTFTHADLAALSRDRSGARPIDLDALGMLARLLGDDAGTALGDAGPGSGRLRQAGATDADVATALLAIVAEVLDDPTVSPDDDLLDLGTDSLSSVRIAAKAVELGIPVSPTDVFEQRTVARLARLHDG